MQIRVATFLILAAMLGEASAQPNVEAGKKIYDTCAGCHGFLAEGNALVNAPSLAGLDGWYMTRQIHSFLNGVRGAQEGDDHGARMALMARAIASDRELDDVVAYVATLPIASSTPSVEGDAAKGQQLFASCAACHGLDGAGNEALSAPRLNRLDDWYVVEQLRLFAEGLRGSAVNDASGQQMRAISTIFADDQARRDLAAYMETLAP